MDDYWAQAPAAPPGVPPGVPARRARVPPRGGWPSPLTVAAAVCSATTALPGVALLRLGMRMADEQDEFFWFVTPLLGIVLTGIGFVLAGGALLLPLALLVGAPGARFAAYGASAVVLTTAWTLGTSPGAVPAVRQLALGCAVGAVATVVLLSLASARAGR